MSKLCVTILAGGMGKRMQSDLPKVLHLVKGTPMIVRLLQQVQLLSPNKILVVVGKFRDQIKKEIEKYIINENIVYVIQPVAMGTGHAIKCTLDEIGDDTTNIILNGDMPMLQYRTVREIYDYYLFRQSNFLITSINLDNPTGNGRIIIDDSNNFKEIIEEKDCNTEQKMITLVNCGIYIVNSDILVKYVPFINNLNSQSEYYLTDLVKIFLGASAKNKIELFTLQQLNKIEIYNINTREQLDFIEKN